MPANKKILLVTIPERGHINPMLSLAQHLQDRGYTFCFYAASDLSTIWSEAGLNGNVYHGGVSLPWDFITKGEEFNKRLQDERWMRHWIKTLLLDVVEDQIKVIEDIIKVEEPAFILSDPMVYAAVISAGRHAIPWVGVSSSLNPFTPSDWYCPLVEMLANLNDTRKAIFNDLPYEAVFRVSDVLSPWLNLAYSCPSYAPSLAPDPYQVVHLGKSFVLEHFNKEDVGYGWSTPMKKVYVSLGSQIFYHPEVFLKISKVCQLKNIRLIAAVNELNENPKFVKAMGKEDILLHYAPQLQILPKVDLMVSHGGANSVMEALSFGKPLLLLPHCNDQYLQARFMEKAQAGLVLDPYTANENDYALALDKILAVDSIFIQNAQEIAIEMYAMGGPRHGALLIDQWVKDKMPLLS